jgi:hypothetical protein
MKSLLAGCEQDSRIEIMKNGQTMSLRGRLRR